jgi:hypothetical protein
LIDKVLAKEQATFIIRSSQQLLRVPTMRQLSNRTWIACPAAAPATRAIRFVRAQVARKHACVLFTDPR